MGFMHYCLMVCTSFCLVYTEIPEKESPVLAFLQQPEVFRSLFLSLVCRKMFFTDYGQIPKVERCDMDGQNRTKLVDSKIVFPHGITLDLVNRLVYWADAYLDYIEVVDYEGKNRHTIIQGLLVRGNQGLFLS